MLIRALATAAILALSATSSIAQEEYCEASWYSLPGQQMANGEIFNPKAAIVAHKTRPLGSWVSIIRVDRRARAYGATVCAQVQDRGPYIKGRCVDVSKPLGRRLGIIGPGTGKVKVIDGCKNRPAKAQTTKAAHESGLFFCLFYFSTGSRWLG